jgi:hypothetical protein
MKPKVNISNINAYLNLVIYLVTDKLLPPGYPTLHFYTLNAAMQLMTPSETKII